MIQDADLAAAVFDQVLPLEVRCRFGHAFPAHAEHVGEELVRHAEFRRAHPVARHQQPAREARADDVEAVAGRGLGNLRHQRVDIAVQPALQRRRAAQRAQEPGLAQLQRGSAALHERAHRGRFDAERQRDADHAFASHHPDLEREVALDDGEQRHQAAQRKVDVAHATARFVKHVAEGQRDRRQARQELLVGLARQRREQQVFVGSHGHPHDRRGRAPCMYAIEQ